MEAFRAKQARKQEIRQEFAEARRHGLRRRHAQKLARNRNRRETAEPNDQGC
jgi:hypothetical protein